MLPIKINLTKLHNTMSNIEYVFHSNTYHNLTYIKCFDFNCTVIEMFLTKHNHLFGAIMTFSCNPFKPRNMKTIFIFQAFFHNDVRKPCSYIKKHPD